MKTFAVLLLLIFALTGFAQNTETRKKSVTWKLDNLKKIGGNQVEVLGNPQIIKTGRGKAVLFDGTRDALLINDNPIAGMPAFTIEALFRPDADGGREQRWFHIEDAENAETRTLLEIRLNDAEWFLDTFIKSGENRSTLYAENFKHPAGAWYKVALVFDGREMRHYVSGKLELTGKITTKPFGKGVTSIGVRQNKIYWFKGAVQKLRFTNRALSPKEFMK
jgi:hypothetical protein